MVIRACRAVLQGILLAAVMFCGLVVAAAYNLCLALVVFVYLSGTPDRQRIEELETLQPVEQPKRDHNNMPGAPIASGLYFYAVL